MNTPQPEDVHKRFAELFAAGDLDGLLGLYEPDAVLLPQPGVQVGGLAAIRDTLSAFLAMNGTFHMPPGKPIQANDIALIFSDWSLTMTGPDGQPSELKGQTSDVLRRQPDGNWRIVIDSPFGAAGLGG